MARKQPISVGGDVLKPPRHLVGVGFGIVGAVIDVIECLGQRGRVGAVSLASQKTSGSPSVLQSTAERAVG
ncbi:MAG TPA: hypothetical protein VE709_07765 [Pseudonocardiaceae bacterium]|nr:hypothetical protein [Pseudonocardiaceae bacterium]